MKTYDLAPLVAEIEALCADFFGETPALAIAFALPGDPGSDVHWVTNVTRDDGIALFRATAAKMAANVRAATD